MRDHPVRDRARESEGAPLRDGRDEARDPKGRGDDDGARIEEPRDEKRRPSLQLFDSRAPRRNFA